MRAALEQRAEIQSAAMSDRPMFPPSSPQTPRTGYVLAVDLGGTRFRAALVDERGGIAHSCAIDSPAGAARQPGWDLSLIHI